MKYYLQFSRPESYISALRWTDAGYDSLKAIADAFVQVYNRVGMEVTMEDLPASVAGFSRQTLWD